MLRSEAKDREGLYQLIQFCNNHSKIVSFWKAESLQVKSMLGCNIQEVKGSSFQMLHHRYPLPQTYLICPSRVVFG